MLSLISKRALRASIAFSALTVAVAANAATVTFSFDTGLVTPEVSSVWQLNRFDSSLGTLTSVAYEFNGHIVADLSYLSKASTGSQSIVADMNVGLKLEESTGAGVLDLSLQPPHLEEPIAYGATKNFHYSADQKVGDINAQITDSTALLYLTGTTPLLFNFSNTDESYTDFIGGNGRADYATTVQATGKIIYTYSPQAVPEPASMAAIGLGVLGMIRRRKAGAAK